MPSNSLYTLITKALSQQLICQDHNLPLLLLNRDTQLICEECQDQDVHPLQSFFDNPISVILWYSNSQKHPQEWMKKSIQQDIQSKLNRSKFVFQTYLEELKTTIAKYCDSIFSEYSALIDKVEQQSSKSLFELQKLNEIYCSQLEEQINGNDLSLPFLNDLIYRFLTVSQNPSDKLSTEIKEVTSALEKFSYLNMQRLTEHYQQLCDPFKWKLSNFVVNHSAEIQMFDNVVDSIHLADKKHYLKYGAQGIALYSYENKYPISINTIPIDDCCQINGYKIYGYNSQQITVFSYLNPLQLEIVSQTKAKFPTNFSYQHPYIYYKSQNIQWKWNTINDPQPLSKPASSQFIKPKESLFRLLQYKQPVQLNIQNNFVTLS